MEQQAQVNQIPQPQASVCKYCQKPIWDSFYFCPNCGKKLKEPPYVFSVGRTIIVILESLFLPPLGLIPGIKYLRMKESGAKLLGIAAIIITILSIIITIVFLKNYIDTVNKQLNDVNYLNSIYSNPQGTVEDQANELQNLSQ